MVKVSGMSTSSQRATFLSDYLIFLIERRLFFLVLAHVYRLISPIIEKCKSTKTDSDKTVQSESSSFVTRVLFSKRKSLAFTQFLLRKNMTRRNL